MYIHESVMNRWCDYRHIVNGANIFDDCRNPPTTRPPDDMATTPGTPYGPLSCPSAGAATWSSPLPVPQARESCKTPTTPCFDVQQERTR